MSKLIPGRTKTIRREDAVERRMVRKKRSHQEQISILDRKLGNGRGATRERAKLERLIEAERNPPRPTGK